MGHNYKFLFYAKNQFLHVTQTDDDRISEISLDYYSWWQDRNNWLGTILAAEDTSVTNLMSSAVYIHLIRPHEANKEDDGKAHGDDINTPEPRPLQRRHQQLFNHSRLQEDQVKYSRCAQCAVIDLKKQILLSV